MNQETNLKYDHWQDAMDVVYYLRGKGLREQSHDVESLYNSILNASSHGKPTRITVPSVKIYFPLTDTNNMPPKMGYPFSPAGYFFDLPVYWVPVEYEPLLTIHIDQNELLSTD